MGWVRDAAAYIGIVPDDRYNQEPADEFTEVVYDDTGAVEGREPSREVARSSRREPSARAEREPVQRTSSSSTREQRREPVRIITVHPRNYNEARTIGEHFRDGVPVIMNLSDMDDADAKRLVDFAAGLIFGLRGTIERVTSKVFLLSPQNFDVTAEDRERIISGGFFNQS